MKIGITGGSGTVGSAIIARGLERGDTLVSVDRVAPKEATDGVTHITADVADYEALVAAFTGCDAVMHMAAIATPRITISGIRPRYSSLDDLARHARIAGVTVRIPTASPNHHTSQTRK